MRDAIGINPTNVVSRGGTVVQIFGAARLPKHRVVAQGTEWPKLLKSLNYHQSPKGPVALTPPGGGRRPAC